MSDEKQTSQEELEQVAFGNALIDRMVGSTIVGFGANEEGGVLLVTAKNGKISETVISAEIGDLEIFEAEGGSDE